MTRLKVRAAPALTGKDRRAAADTMMRAAMRAQKHGWQATEGPNSAFFVPSASQPLVARTVRLTTGMDGVIWAHCTCPGGYHRRENAPVVCWHGAAVLGLLFGQRRVRPVNGLMVWGRP